jgi:N-formylglutamate deformylase
VTASIFTLHRGTRPLLVSVPHAGTRIAEEVRPQLVERAGAVEDTDWFVDRLYDFVRELGASLIVPVHSRYVIDLNRPSADTPLYAGANNTGLVPTRFFTGEPLYRDGQEPGAAEIARRVRTYWQPYHDALAAELARLRSAHGHAVLWDGHSIRSEVPWLFSGRLPALNLGTANRTSCAPGLCAALAAVLAAQSRFSHVIDGRFKGGHITRHYGRPAGRVHAIQLEMCQRTYMDEAAPSRLDPARVAALEPVLRALLDTALRWSGSNA